MTKQLVQAVRDHYETYRLDPGELAQLKTMQLQRRPSNRRVYAWASALVAVMVLAIGLRYTLIYSQHNQLRAAIVSEVVANHLKNEPVKNATTDLTDLRMDLDRLNFHLSSPEPPAGQSLSLLGGGYCSIQNHIAAQLQYRFVAADEVVTLYQVALPRSWRFLASRPYQTEYKGLHVTLWVENDVFFALAFD